MAPNANEPVKPCSSLQLSGYTISLSYFLSLSLSRSSSVTLASFAKASKFIAHFLSATWAFMRHVCVLCGLCICVLYVCVCVCVCVCWLCVYYIQLHAISGQPLFAIADIDRRQPPRLINGLPSCRAKTKSERVLRNIFHIFHGFSSDSHLSHFNSSFIYAKAKLSGDTLAPSTTTTTITNCPAVEWNYNN